MEGQSFGLSPSYGGPYAGVIASREKFVRQMPGRLAGQTIESGRPPWLRADLATREQHIRSEKATSNICTNEALCALAATVHLTLLGKEGIREMAEHNLSKAQFALGGAGENSWRQARISRTLLQRVRCGVAALGQNGERRTPEGTIIGPFVLGSAYPELTKHALVCVTETTTRAEIERFAAALSAPWSSHYKNP